MTQNLRTSSYDAVVVGSGPNGLAAGIRLAQAGLSALVLEGSSTLGGAARSAELTLPGFTHDVCSAVHPLAIGSPFFKTLPLENHGLQWINPPAILAHPLDGAQAVIIHRDLAETVRGLAEDGAAYMRLLDAHIDRWDELSSEVLGPMLHWPKAPILLARFGLKAIQSATWLARHQFRSERARAVFAGLAAHSCLPLEQKGSAAYALILAGAGHAVGWPLPRGGAGHITQALAAHLRVLGGEIHTGVSVGSIGELPLSRVIMLDVTPLQVLEIAGHELPPAYFGRLERFRYGPGVFKMDFALSEPIPWSAPECRTAPTVHLGGSFDEICASEAQVYSGRTPEKPFVILVQPTVFDPTRAPSGGHIVWGYCHVPHGSTHDMSKAIEDQIERFAPGFRDCILMRHTSNAMQLQRENPNLVGGDINGGAGDLSQLVARPVFGRKPYRTAVPGLYLCSASTPPGGGVHGMCGFHAAETALRDMFRGRYRPAAR